MPSTPVQPSLFPSERKEKTTALSRKNGFHSSLDVFRELLSSDLDFHGQSSNSLSHDFHAFPAKFPPQLPQLFIENLTEKGDVVLDPMIGSGTTVLEAYACGRAAIGFDIDPLARLLTKAKVTQLSLEEVFAARQEVLSTATKLVEAEPEALTKRIARRLDEKSQKFIDYWFAPETQIELQALWEAIQQIQDKNVHAFYTLAFSAIIITKSGGVSLARDLAHTRPHKVTDKTPRSPLTEFQRRLEKNISSLQQLNAIPQRGTARIEYGDAQQIPLEDASVDLIVTSPPYAANAIDYMRAHKFSLVWLGHPIDELGKKRRDYIGGEATNHFVFEDLQPKSIQVIQSISAKDAKKAKVLHRYYSEMKHSLGEMYRVLKPGKTAVVVVGTSLMRGIDTQTHFCLGEIGESVGFDLVDIAVRRLDRDKRMMPARWNNRKGSQIEERMHEEYILGFYKPEQ